MRGNKLKNDFIQLAFLLPLWVSHVSDADGAFVEPLFLFLRKAKNIEGFISRLKKKAIKKVNDNSGMNCRSFLLKIGKLNESIDGPL